MKRIALAVALVASLCAAPAVAQETALAGFGWFADLAGSCWSGTQPDGRTVDTQCYLTQYGRLMRGSLKVGPAGEQPVFEGDGVFAVAPGESGKVIYTQWGTGGIYATGEMVLEGETLVFHSRLPDGKPSPVRHIWRRAGPDGFRVTRERNVDSKWVELHSVEYKRIPGK